MHVCYDVWCFTLELVQFTSLYLEHIFSSFLAVQYIIKLYDYLKDWLKNPHFSISCCLALLLPLNDLQGDIHGLAGTNLVNNQLDSGQMDTTTVIGAVRTSGAIDVTLEEREKENSDAMADVQEENCPIPECNRKNAHKQTQTDLFMLSTQ